MDKVKRGIISIEEHANRLAAKLSNIDLSEYYEESISHSIKPAGEYKNSLLSVLVGENRQYGDSLPWDMVRDRFELRDAEMTIWTGYKGHGKSLLLSQIFSHLFLRNRKAFILSPEFRPEKVLERLLYQHVKHREPEAEQLEKWLDSMDKLLWLYDIQSSLKPADVIAICRYVMDKIGVNHILIDSLMKCGIAPDDYASQKKFVDKLQNVAHTTGCHIHLVAHARKGDHGDLKPARLHDVKGSTEIADMAENVVSVWRNKNKEREIDDKALAIECDAIFSVEAQRNADGWIGQINLDFDKQSMLFYERGKHPTGESYVRF